MLNPSWYVTDYAAVSFGFCFATQRAFKSADNSFSRFTKIHSGETTVGQCSSTP